MRKNKFIYSLSAVALACIISFSGVGNSYIQVHATSVGIEKGVWNDDASAWENIRQYIRLFASAYGIYVNPSWETILWGIESHNDFYNFMVSDGYTEEQAEETVHGGGGHVRDGITQDSNGNVTYSDEVSDLFYNYIRTFLMSQVKYFYLPTTDVDDLDMVNFTDKNAYNNLVSFVNDVGIVCLNKSYDGFALNSCGVDFLTFYDEASIKADYSRSIYPIYDDWTYEYTDHYLILNSYINDDLTLDSGYHDFYSVFSSNVTASDFTDISVKSHTKFYNICLRRQSTGSYPQFRGVVSSDGRDIRIWTNIDDFKSFDVGHQNFYATDSFNNYDSTIDNSTTITSQEYAYYNDNSTTIYETIQNNINNYGGEIDEKAVQDIVDSVVQEIKDSIANSGNQGGNDSGDSDNGGNGVGDLVGGIGKLLDTILSLIGKVMGVVADFSQSILDLFTGFTDFTDGFSNFLSGAFSFIPQEIWNVIQVGLSLVILLAVIKFFRK